VADVIATHAPLEAADHAHELAVAIVKEPVPPALVNA
jgi:hypothetical protein